MRRRNLMAGTIGAGMFVTALSVLPLAGPASADSIRDQCSGPESNPNNVLVCQMGYAIGGGGHGGANILNVRAYDTGYLYTSAQGGGGTGPFQDGGGGVMCRIEPTTAVCHGKDVAGP